jgi:cardiolipin synthase
VEEAFDPGAVQLPAMLRPAAVPAPGRTLFGNAVTVLPDGRSIFEAMIAEIARARRSIAIEMYTWQDDRIGRRFADAVAARIREGVPVYIVLDSFGSLTSGRLGDDLQASGARLVWYNPLDPRAVGAWSPNQRNHRKLVLVDGTIGFTGGMNLSEDYTDEFRGDLAWRDLAVRVEGPAVREMTRMFLSSWRQAGGKTRGMGPLIVPPKEVGKAGVDVLRWRGGACSSPTRTSSRSGHSVALCGERRSAGSASSCSSRGSPTSRSSCGRDGRRTDVSSRRASASAR